MADETDEIDRAAAARPPPTLPFARRFGLAFLGSAAVILVLAVMAVQDILLGLHVFVELTTETLIWLRLDALLAGLIETLNASMPVALTAIASWAAILAVLTAALIAAVVRAGGPLTFLTLGLLLPVIVIGVLQAL